MIYWLSEQKINHPNIKQVGVDDVIRGLKNSEHIGWDTETTGLVPMYHKPLLEIFTNGRYTVVIDLRTTKKKDLVRIHNSIKNVPWIAHNAKFDYKMMMWHYPDLALGLCWDTMVAARILYNGFDIGGFSLKNLLKRFMKIDMDKEVRNSFIGKKDNSLFTVEEIMYAADDVIYLKQLKDIEIEKGLQFNYQPLFEMEMKFTKVLSKIELKGFRFNKDKWLEIAEAGTGFLFGIQTKLDKILNDLGNTYKKLISSGLTRIRYENCNPDAYNKYSSPDTLFKIFECTGEINNLPLRDDYDEFKAKKILKLKARNNRNKRAVFEDGTTFTQGSLFDVQESTPRMKYSEMYKLGKPELEAYLKADKEHKSPLREFVKELLRFRETEKLVNTYGIAFLDSISKDGRARTNFSQVFTATGRLSSSSYTTEGKKTEGYNAQNIPQNKAMRSCFMADDGYMIATIDYSGQEIALAASQSKDPTLVKNVTEGLDIHSLLATETFRLITGDPAFKVSQEVNKDKRGMHKPILFGLFYGAGPKRIATILDVKMDMAKKIYNRIRSLLPNFFEYQDRVQENARINRYVLDNTKFGRRRWFTPESPIHKVEKQASNFPMQSSGASMIKEAIVRIDAHLEQYRARYPNICIIGTVHDEILFHIPADRIDIAFQCYDIMKEVGDTYLEDMNINASMAWEPWWTK